MKLRNLKISNFRRVQSIELNLDGKSAVLTGRNGAGKSSIIDAVWVALTGKDVPDAPIHHGAHKAEIQADLDSIGDPMEEMRTAESTNRIADAQERRRDLTRQMEEARRAMSDAKAEAATTDEERASRISAAEFPVQGLSFSEDGVLFEGLPLSDKQLSTAKVIEIGIAIAISRNPGLRICRIKDGSLLDSHTTDRIMETCHKHGFQVLVERVGDGDLHAEILEDADTTDATTTTTQEEIQ